MPLLVLLIADTALIDAMVADTSVGASGFGFFLGIFGNFDGNDSFLEIPLILLLLYKYILL
jgi:hypothetical protein